MPWAIRSSRVALEDRWIKVRADECVTADGTIVSPYYVLEYPDWVHMVVINNNDQVLVTEQYRHGAKNISFELPCGIQEEGEEPLETAKRELLEETGYSGDFAPVGQVSPNPATHSNYIHVFLVTSPVKQSRVHTDLTEIINYDFMDVNRVYELIDRGDFQQGLHISSLVLGLRKHQKAKDGR